MPPHQLYNVCCLIHTFLFKISFDRHEVRNPLAASLSACTFVVSELHKSNGKPIPEASSQVIAEDVEVIDNSLKFINDLLRSMLDVHRAANNQLVLQEDSVDILKDIFEPIKSLIYVRDAQFEVKLDTPAEGLVVQTDRIRLQQITLNLTRNASKFVVEGPSILPTQYYIPLE